MATSTKTARAAKAAPAAAVPTMEQMMQMMAQMQAQLAAAQATPAAKPTKAAKAAPAQKPKAKFDGHALYKTLKALGADGVEESATSTGRAKITAFCADGYIVTVMSDKG